MNGNSGFGYTGTTAARTAVDSRFAGSLRAVGQSRIEKLLQVREFQELANCLTEETEREGFEPSIQAFTRMTV